MSAVRGVRDCLRRAWLLAPARRGTCDASARRRLATLLALADEELHRGASAAGSGRDRAPSCDGFDAERAPGALRARRRVAALLPLRSGLPGAAAGALERRPPSCTSPAALERFAATLARDGPVAIVGARRASAYGLEIARVAGARAGRPPA